MINVTKPFLPPIEDYLKIIQKIWQSNILTNMGPISQDFEEKLKIFYM